MKRTFLFLQLTTLITTLFLGACQSPRKPKVTGSVDLKTLLSDSARIVPQEAKGFKVKYLKNGIRLVDLLSYEGSSTHTSQRSYHLALIPRGVQSKDIPSVYQDRIEVPIRRCIPMSTEYLADIIALGALDKVTGITSTRYLQDPEVKRRVREGIIAKIGYEGSFDQEVILAARPEVIFISPFKRGGYDVLRQTGITLIPVFGYKESTALGQAEWIKFFAMFIGKEKEANQYFRQLTIRYHRIKALAAKAKTQPTVFCGDNEDGNWYVWGGKSFLAGLFRDAGARYLPENDSHTGAYPTDFETIYHLAANADYWRILNNYPGKFSYSALQAADYRNTKFRAFRRRQVIYCNIRTSAYHEQAPLHPDWVLADLVHALHPELMKNYRPRFYSLLP